MFGWLRRRKIEKLASQSFAEEWRDIVRRNVPAVSRLVPDQRALLERSMLVFLAEKTFEGCAGQVIDDEVRVTIAAQACLVVLGRTDDPYPGLETILVYPTTFEAETKQSDGLIVTEGKQARLGESWTHGLVVLAWDAVLSGSKNPRDGKNVVFHEFAHQLDAEDGGMDGAPDLGPPSRYGAWARVLEPEFESLQDLADEGRRSLLDPYGATNPPEFFAVVTEVFFEKPQQLKKRHPTLYAKLVEFYKQDPAEQQ